MTGGGGPGPDTGGGHIGLVVTDIALGVVAHFSGVRRALVEAPSGLCGHSASFRQDRRLFHRYQDSPQAARQK